MAFFGPPPSFVGATTSADGASGLVPAPASGNSSRSLLSNSTFRTPLPLPKFKPTSDIVSTVHGGGGTSATATIAPTIKLRYFSLLYLPSDGNIDELFFRTGSSAPSPAFNCHVAIWKVSENGDPSDYIIGGTGSSGTSTSTDISIPVTSTYIESGIYWISFTSDATGSASSILAMSGTGQAFWRRIVTSNLGSVGNNPNYTATTYNQTTHETFLYSSQNVPSLGARYE